MSELYLGRVISVYDRRDIQGRIDKLQTHLGNVQEALERVDPVDQHILLHVQRRLEVKKQQLQTCLNMGIFITNTPWEVES